jgi:hypothetical protein
VQRISAAVGFTTAPVAIGATTGVLPEFGRWQYVQRLFGIKKGTLYNLVNDGMVKTVHLRRKGNEHGCTLFYLPGISQLLHATMDAQNPPKSQPSNQIDLDLGSTAHTQAQ